MAVKTYFGLRAGSVWVTGFSLMIAQKRLKEACGGELPLEYDIWRVHPATQLNLFGDLVFPKGYPPKRHTGGSGPKKQTKKEGFAKFVGDSSPASSNSL